MASISGSRSGGKILRSRRNAAKTPYDRPPRSPNWLSRFVLSPTRFVAGKLVSTVLDLESSPTSSSTSDSGDEEVATVKDNSDIPFEGDNALKKGLQPLIGSGANKHVIEQLLMQETFSREEGDRLISIIRSRRVDSPAEDDGDKRPRDMPNNTLGSDSPDLYSAAVMEAKKWLQEKKLGLDSNSDLGYGSHSLTSVKLPQAFEDGGSPVDVAKSYMRIRPAWVFPSVDHNKPPSPTGIQLFKDETPYLIGGNSTSYFKGFGAHQQTIGSQSDCREITTSGQKHGSSDDVVPMMHGLEYLLVDSPFQYSFAVRISTGQVIEQNTKSLDIEHDTVDSGQQGTAKGALELETCKLLSETSMEVPDVIGNNNLVVNEDCVATGSQSSSSAA